MFSLALFEYIKRFSGKHALLYACICIYLVEMLCGHFTLIDVKWILNFLRIDDLMTAFFAAAALVALFLQRRVCIYIFIIHYEFGWVFRFKSSIRFCWQFFLLLLQLMCKLLTQRCCVVCFFSHTFLMAH